MLSSRNSCSLKISDKLYLNSHEVDTVNKAIKPKVALNHVYCCDISGSMSRVLPQMREQLKNKLSSIVNPGDTVTIIAFADGSDCYVIKKLAKLDNGNDLKQMQDAIDKYLRPECCTDFRLPINETRKIFTETKTNAAWNWIFLSDGGHNCGPFQQVVDGLNAIKSDVASCTIIEYGYWADSDRLSQMAQILGGTKVPAKDFDSYLPVIEGAFKGKGKGSKKIVVDANGIRNDLKVDLFFYVNGDITVIAPDARGMVYVPEGVGKIYSISEKVLGDTVTVYDETALYAAAYVFADLPTSQLMSKYEVVKAILVKIADGKFLELFNDAYGKQKLFEFQTQIREATFDDKKRGKKLTATQIKAIKSKYCVMDLINDLTSDEDNKICVASPDFQYNRIGAKQVEKADENGETVKVHQIDKGYPINNLIWNEERANLSIQSTIDVELEPPTNKFVKKIKSKIVRNYTVIKDGIVNMTELPLILSDDTYNKFKENELLVFRKDKVLKDGTHKVVLNFSKLPVINTAKLRACKMSTLTKNALKLNDYKFELKYLGYLKKSFVASTASEDDVPADRKEFYASLGIKNGIYSPKTVTEKTGDFYMALTLNSEFDGIKSIPKIEDVEKKLKTGNSFTQAEAYMKSVMDYIDRKYLSKKKGEDYKNAVNDAFDILTTKKREVQEKVAQTKFTLVVSRKWFTDRKNFDDNHDTIASDFGSTLTIDYTFADKKVNL
jgi:lipocalin